MFKFNDENKVFITSQVIAILWFVFSLVIAIPWIKDLGGIVTIPFAIVIVSGIALIPGYINSFFVATAIFGKKNKLDDDEYIPEDVTILIACRNEEENIYETLGQISKQNYLGKINVIIIDNGSKDDTAIYAEKAKQDFGLNLTIIYEVEKGKHNALNSALNTVSTDYVITIDADTILYKYAIANLVRRMQKERDSTTAVVGHIFVSNVNENLITKMQNYDYFLGIGPIKKIQGAYNSTLVAQGAFSLYRTKDLIEIGGWPNSIGEDIVLSWKLLRNNHKIVFEPYAIAFTKVPNSLKLLTRQRSRWARGMIEALKAIKPWQQPSIYVKFLTFINLIIPFIDISYLLFFIPGIILSFVGFHYIAGIMTLVILPLMAIQNYIYYKYQKEICNELHLNPVKTKLGFISYICIYQLISSYMSLKGYFEELFKFKWQWK